MLVLLADISLLLNREFCLIVPYIRDYRPNPVLDRYDDRDLDDEDYDNIDVADRLAAEMALQERDEREGRRRGDRDLLYGERLKFADFVEEVVESFWEDE